MADPIVGGRSEVEEETLRAIDGRTVRRILQIGLRSEFARLSLERAKWDKLINENAGLRTRPGDTESAEELWYRRKNQTDDRDTVLAKLAHCESRLRLYDPEFVSKEPNQPLSPSSVAPSASEIQAPHQP